MRNRKGFTLIELLAVLAIASILFGVGLPALENMVRDSASAAASFELISQLGWARQEAVTLRRRVVICRSGQAGTTVPLPQCDVGPSSDRNHDGYEDGWLLFIDDNQNWQPDQPSDILRRHSSIATGGVTIRGQSKGDNPDHLGFTSLGQSAGTAGTLILCDARGWALGGHWAHAIVISPVGRIKDTPGDSPGLTVSSCTP